MWRKIVRIMAGLLFAAGAAVMASPAGEDALHDYQERKEIDRFRQEYVSPGDDNKDYSELLEQMKAYNTEIFENGQEGLSDAWSFEQDAFDLKILGLEDNLVGYITIPAMDEELPLYLGADEENLSKGAAVLAKTSMPIGGMNTNCVIAGHRGYGGAAMFRDIEALSVGDKVYITNPWETLTYEVVHTIAIRPDDLDAVKIVEGEDLVTLVTCHPYMHNYQRYVVYCQRVHGETDKGAGGNVNSEGMAELMGRGGISCESSEQDVRMSEIMSLIGAALLLLMIVVLTASLIRRLFFKGRKESETEQKAGAETAARRTRRRRARSRKKSGKRRQ